MTGRSALRRDVPDDHPLAVRVASVTACACGSPASAGAVSTGSGKYIIALREIELRGRIAPYPASATSETRYFRSAMLR